MRGALGEVSQWLVMAAVVATLLYWPLGIALAVIFAVGGVPLQAFVTFGGSFGLIVGMVVWWLLGFALSLGYAASVFPWGASSIASSSKDSSWPRKK